MKDNIILLIVCCIAAVTVLIVDFDDANRRWCATYPEICEPTDTEVAHG